MASSRNQIFGSVIGSAGIAIIILVLLFSYAPDAVPFSSQNYGWNGLHQVNTAYEIHPVTALSSVPASRGNVMLVIAPTLNFTQAQANSATQFVIKGGTLVVADRTGIADTLLEGMGVSIYIDGNVVKDTLYNWKSQSLPIAVTPSLINNTFPFLTNVKGLALDTPSALTVTSTLAIPVAFSSSISKSYTTSGGSLTSLSPSQTGPFAMVAVEKLGLGQVIVIGDSTFFTNSVWTNANNEAMVKNLFANSNVYIDTSHWPSNTGEVLRAQFLNFFSQLSGGDTRYLFTMGVVGASIVIAPVFWSALESKPKPVIVKSVNTYNEKILSRIRKDREKHGARSD